MPSEISRIQRNQTGKAVRCETKTSSEVSHRIYSQTTRQDLQRSIGQFRADLVRIRIGIHYRLKAFGVHMKRMKSSTLRVPIMQVRIKKTNLRHRHTQSKKNMREPSYKVSIRVEKTVQCQSRTSSTDSKRNRTQRETCQGPLEHLTAILDRTLNLRTITFNG